MVYTTTKGPPLQSFSLFLCKVCLTCFKRRRGLTIHYSLILIEQLTLKDEERIPNPVLLKNLKEGLSHSMVYDMFSVISSPYVPNQWLSLQCPPLDLSNSLALLLLYSDLLPLATILSKIKPKWNSLFQIHFKGSHPASLVYFAGIRKQTRELQTKESEKIYAFPFFSFSSTEPNYHGKARKT